MPGQAIRHRVGALEVVEEPRIEPIGLEGLLDGANIKGHIHSIITADEPTPRRPASYNLEVGLGCLLKPGDLKTYDKRDLPHSVDAVVVFGRPHVHGQGQAPQPPAAADHVPRRGQLRRGRCARARCARQVRHRPASRRTSQVFEDGKPQKVTAFSLVNIPVERAERPLFASQADRARRAEQPAGAPTAAST